MCALRRRPPTIVTTDDDDGNNPSYIFRIIQYTHTDTDSLPWLEKRGLISQLAPQLTIITWMEALYILEFFSGLRHLSIMTKEKKKMKEKKKEEKERENGGQKVTEIPHTHTNRILGKKPPVGGLFRSLHIEQTYYDTKKAHIFSSFCSFYAFTFSSKVVYGRYGICIWHGMVCHIHKYGRPISIRFFLWGHVFLLF